MLRRVLWTLVALLVAWQAGCFWCHPWGCHRHCCYPPDCESSPPAAPASHPASP
jgi:hypothetical protein